MVVSIAEYPEALKILYGVYRNQMKFDLVRKIDNIEQIACLFYLLKF